MTIMKIRTTNWNNRAIRFAEHENEWWAVAKDVAKALGYAQTDDMLNLIKSENIEFVFSSLLINEKGIYQAILGSKTPGASDFKDMVFDMIFEILKFTPQISGLENFEIFRMMDKEWLKELKGDEGLDEGFPKVYGNLLDRMVKRYKEKIKITPTKELVEELKTREGVKVKIAKPHTGLKLETKGPATVLIVTD